MTPRTVEEFCTLVDGLAANGRSSELLEAICDFVMDVISRETTLGRVLSSPQLDEMCLKLGRLMPTPAPKGRDEDQIVFVVTALYRGGGHSRVLLDLASADPAGKFKVLVTNLRHDYPVDDIQDVFRFVGAATADTVEVAPPGDATGRLRWLQQRLAALRPARTYLLQHNYDFIAIAAAQPELVGRLIYIHHCDHSLTLGVHVPHATHIDLDPRIFYSCRDHLGITGNAMWPLTAPVAQHRADLPFLATGHLTTCTSGTTHKFDASYFKEHLPYALSYAAIVAVLLKEGGGTHLHIGQLSDRMVGDIQRELDAAGIGRDRFVNIPVVPNLADALIEHRVDAYVGSFPYGGGRATVEVMGAGVPLLMHSNYRSIFFSNSVEAYPGAMIWRTPGELAQHLHAITPELLQSQAHAARRHYEQRSAPPLLRDAMRRTLASDRLEPPPRPSHHPDMLQVYLDECVLLGPGRAGGEDRAQLGAQLELINQRLAESGAEIRKLRAHLTTQEENVAALQSDVTAKEAERQALTSRLLETQQQIEAMQNSRSWRVTAGLRAVSDALAKLRRS